MKLSVSVWEKQLLSWCNLECGEAALICRVIATAICDEPSEALDKNREPYASEFFVTGWFRHYCRAVGLEADFVMEQVKRANASDGEWSEAVKKIKEKDRREKAASG